VRMAFLMPRLTVSLAPGLLAVLPWMLRTTKRGPDRRVRSKFDIVPAWMQFVP
jgi:hypothetical protein